MSSRSESPLSLTEENSGLLRTLLTAFAPSPLDQQEQRVLQLLGEAGLQNSQATENVREMCRMTSGFVGVRPLFVMRFTAKTLSHLPDEVSSRIAASKVSRAEVGACPNEQQEFSMYNLAIALYR